MSSPKILVIPDGRFKEYDTKGHQREERAQYYNPTGSFEIIGLEQKKEGTYPFDYCGFPVYSYDASLDGIERTFQKFTPDVVRAYNTRFLPAAFRASDYYSVPLVVSVHNLFPSADVKYADKVLCVSSEVVKKVEAVGTDPSKIVLLPDRIDLLNFNDYRGSPEVDELVQKYSGSYKVLSVGRLVWEKNLERLVQATHDSNELLGGGLVHMHIGKFGRSSDSLVSDLKELMAREGHVVHLENVSQSELPYYFSWADVFAMASLSEGNGLVYQEALACGTPVLTSNLSPMNSYVLDGQNGLLVDPNDSSDIARGLVKVLTDDSLRNSLALNARRSVMRFDSTALQEVEAEIYFDLVKNGK